ncbi:YadA-like family protein, partial [Salmonella enterica]
NANNYTDASSKSTLKKANNYTDNRFEHFGTQISNDVLEKSYSYTERRSVAAENNAVRRANTYTDSKFGQLNTKIEQAEKRFNAGIAGVTAISSIPYVSENNVSWGIGGGNYQNGNALAAGVQLKMSPNTNVRLNVSWDSAGNSAAGVGFAGGW